jgi:hypothetical protein
MNGTPCRNHARLRYVTSQQDADAFEEISHDMIHRSIHTAIAAAIVASALPAAALADSNSPFTLGVGKFIPTSTSSSVEGFVPFPGTDVRQSGNVSFEVSFGRDVIPGGYQVTAMLLSQHQTGSFASISGPVSADETITQIPVLFEGAGTHFGPVRFGGGLGYDFVSHRSLPGAPSANGIVGDTFLELGLASGAALEAKYIFGQRAALGGIYVGVKARL